MGFPKDIAGALAWMAHDTSVPYSNDSFNAFDRETACQQGGADAGARKAEGGWHEQPDGRGRGMAARQTVAIKAWQRKFGAAPETAQQDLFKL